MTSPVRIAVVGAGVIGQAHARRIREEPQAALAGIADPSPRAKDLAAALETDCFQDLDTLLRTAKPDGAVIATPNRLHVDNALACIAAGVPVLVEKPIADEVESALSLVEASEKAGVPILVGHHRRHSPRSEERRVGKECRSR